MNTVKLEAIFLACAHAAHEANRAYCAALGDTSQPEWHAAPEWQRTSALNGVRGVLIDGDTPVQSHESWMREKRESGWTFGEAKDPVSKTHPCMVDYDRLPEAQRAKDTIFVTTVRVMAAALGWETPSG